MSRHTGKGLVAGGLLLAGVTTAAVALAGNVEGPFTRMWTVGGGVTDIWTFGFRELSPAVVKVKGDGSSDLDCYAYDNDDTLVAMDDEGSDLCVLRWTPPATRKYRIFVKNRGSKPNEYTFTTN